jgi:hypothetical protein
MLANAALILQEARRTEEAKGIMANLRRREPDYDIEGLFTTFYSLPADVEYSFRKGLAALTA